MDLYVWLLLSAEVTGRSSEPNRAVANLFSAPAVVPLLPFLLLHTHVGSVFPSV